VELEGYPAPRAPKVHEVRSVEDLMPYARFLVTAPEWRRNKVGFVGYGRTKPGDRVLLAAHTLYDPWVIEATARALREVGAKVDTIIVDEGLDRELDYLDEIRVIMRRAPWTEAPRRYEGVPWVEELAAKNRYDLLIHGIGGPIPNTSYRYEGFPWTSRWTFATQATIFPPEVNDLINRKAWDLIYRRGRGGRVRVTDPEGTDFTFTLWDEYFDGRYGFSDIPLRGHVMGHPIPPFIDGTDAVGVVAGATSHFTRPFPHIKVSLNEGQATRVEGGGPYGDAWRDLLEESRGTTYPGFPRPGLFWLFELAIGTNPKVYRPRDVLRMSSGGAEYERYRSGVIHVGIGSLWGDPGEQWAAQNRKVYGHLHVHLLFPTYEITTKSGERMKVIEKGRLTALDDPEVRTVAAKYGNPDELLREDWIPGIPGINVTGNYWVDYAADPVPWIKKELGID